MKLFIIPSWYPTKLHPESGTFFADRAGFFQAAGHDVTVISTHIHSFSDFFHFRKVGQTSNGFRLENGLAVYRFEAVNPWPGFQAMFFNYYRKNLVQLFNRAVEEKGCPDAVIVNSTLWAGTALAPRLQEMKIPFVTSEHLKEFIVPGAFDRFKRNSIKASYSKTSQTVATSPALKNGIGSNFPDYKNKLTIIPNPVDTDFFQPARQAESESKGFTFIATALLRKEKRLDLLIESFARLKDENSDILLKIAGDGPERQNLVNLIDKLDVGSDVELLGYLEPEQVRRELLKSQALVLPSDVETFGVALIEAMACGLPVVATRCGGPEDIVNEKSGILVDKNDLVKLSEGMARMMQQYDNFDKGVIRNYAVESFGSESYVRRYEKLLNSLA